MDERMRFVIRLNDGESMVRCVGSLAFRGRPSPLRRCSPDHG
jgi:hypothetical protein